MDIKLYCGDCLEVMKGISDKSVDMVLTDPPYGTMKGIDAKYDWDEIVPIEQMYKCVDKILRPNGKLILFAQQPFTTSLISKAIRNIPHSYNAIWLKRTFGNGMMAKTAMTQNYEDICVFSKRFDADLNCNNPLRAYFKNVLEFIGAKSCKEINNKLGHRRAEHCFYVSGNKLGSSQFELCTEKTYNELIEKFHIDKMDGFKIFKELQEENELYKTANPSIFNLWQGNKSKSNVLEYAKDKDHFHPTQKPVALLEDLIKTYSNENDTVLDFTMGSGSTGVACINTNRNFIGIEKDDGYFDIGKERLVKAMKEVNNE